MSYRKYYFALSLFLLLALSCSFAPTNAGATGTGPLRVLTYHRFDTASWISTPMPEFKRQMGYLMDNGYRFLTVEQVYHHVRTGRPFPEKSVLIVIDDGYNSVHYNAYPFLKKHGIPAVINIYPRAQNQDYEAYLDWDTVAAMAENPLIHIGNHTYSHNSLLETGGETEALRREVLEANREIKKHTGESPVLLALAYGSYDRDIMNKLNNFDSGPGLVFSTLPGVIKSRNDSSPLRRYMVDRHTDMERFKSILHREQLKIDPSTRDGARLDSRPDTLLFEVTRINRIDTSHLHLFLNGEKLTNHFRPAADTGAWKFSVPAEKLSTWNQLMIIGLDKRERIYRTFSMGFVVDSKLPKDRNQVESKGATRSDTTGR